MVYCLLELLPVLVWIHIPSMTGYFVSGLSVHLFWN